MEEKEADAANTWHDAIAEQNSNEIAANCFARLQMPQFNEANMENWFYLLDFYFRAVGIAQDDRKFNTVCSQLPPGRITEFRQIIDNAPAEAKYDYLKEQLLTLMGTSRQKRLRQLLHEMQLGDKRPSQLYYEMLLKSEGILTESILIDLWTSRLPPSVQTAVIICSGSAREKTKIADSVFENIELTHANYVSSATAEPSIEQLCAAVSNLTNQVQRIAASVPNQRASNRRGGNRALPGEGQWQSRNEDSKFDTCWYHRKFGTRATNCRPPCRFQQVQNQQ